MFLCFSLVLSSFAAGPTENFDENGIETSFAVSAQVDLDKGTAQFNFSGTSRLISLSVKKSDTTYYYKTYAGAPLTVPLNMGDGEYVFTAYLHVSANLAQEGWTLNESVKLKNNLSPYLSTSQIVNWSPDMAIAKVAKELAKNKTQEEAAIEFCKYIADNYSYELFDVENTYIPNLEKVYKKKSGICYDMAAMYTAMCRSAGIPCKLVMGYSEYFGSKTYHAWGSVYVDGTWKIIDPVYSMTYGATFLDSKKTTATKQY